MSKSRSKRINVRDSDQENTIRSVCSESKVENMSKKRRPKRINVRDSDQENTIRSVCSESKVENMSKKRRPKRINVRDSDQENTIRSVCSESKVENMSKKSRPERINVRDSDQENTKRRLMDIMKVGLNLPDERFAKGFKNDSLEFISSFIASKNCRYQDFVKVWKDMEFSLIFSGWKDAIALQLAIEEMFIIVKFYLLPSMASSIRKCAIFLLYGLYMRQPCKSGYRLRGAIKIPLEVFELSTLSEFIFKESSGDSSKELVHIMRKMIENEAFAPVLTSDVLAEQDNLGHSLSRVYCSKLDIEMELYAESRKLDEIGSERIQGRNKKFLKMIEDMLQNLPEKGPVTKDQQTGSKSSK